MKSDANIVIEEIIGRKIDWYVYQNLDKGRWQNYKNDAKQIVENEVFLNELNHYITDLIKFIAYEADSFDKVLHIRTAIVTLETFRERLEKIESPEREKTAESLDEAI